MPNLFPEGYETETVELSELAEDTTIGYRGGMAFDNEKGDYIRDGKNKILDSSGIESWKCWCINCLSTQRYAHLAYSTDFGIDIEAAMKAESHAEAESILTREITDALMADPYDRTDYIYDISFNWETPDSVLVHLTIKGIDDVTLDLLASILGDTVQIKINE